MIIGGYRGEDVVRFTIEWEVTKSEDNMLLREFVKEKGISRAALTDIKFKGGNLMVNGMDETVRYMLSRGDKVTVCFPVEKRSEEMVAEDIPLTIIYEDDYVLVVNKPANLPTIPSREHPTGTLANALLYYYDKHCISSTVHVVTRLDKDTSGLLLVAKNRYVHHLLSQQQKEKSVKRIYKAIVHGELVHNKGTIDAPIGRSTTSIIEREVSEDGQDAVTHYEVKKALSDMTLVTVTLDTGRTHQIRVHFAYLGHPLIGDDLYGGKVEKIKRQALHSAELSFYHPFLKRTMNFHAPLPKDMEELVQKVKEG